MDDNRIIELYDQRDESAVAETGVKYGAYLGTIAYNVLRNHEDSEECVQDSYVKTWNAIPPAKPSSLKAFIGKITRNTALDMLDKKSADKRGGGEAALALDELAECISRGSDTPQQALEAKELKTIINDALGGFSKDARKIFVLRYYYMYSVTEIAGKLACTENKVSTSLSRSRAELKTLLAKEGY